MNATFDTPRGGNMRRVGFRVSAVVLLALASLPISAGSASAYTLLDCKWGGNPTNNATLNVQYNSTWASTLDRTAWSDAIEAWNATPNAQVTFAPKTTSALTVSDRNNSSTSWDGWTDHSCSGGNFNYARAYINWYYTSGYTAIKKRSVAAHELGHTTGLGDMGSVMALMNGNTPSRYGTYGVSSPKPDDVNGVNSIY